MAGQDTNHFKKRQRQLIAIAAAIVTIILVVAGINLRGDLAQAKLEQQWGLWRDDNCTLVNGDAQQTTRSSNDLYGPAKHAGAPGVWNCRDGSTHTLHNSDQPPTGWAPPGNPQ